MNGDAGREAILNAGVDVLFEHGLFEGLASLRLRTAARRASYASSTAYRYWSTQDAFRAEVLATAVARRGVSPVTETVAGIRALVEAGQPLDEIIRAGASANVHRRPDDDFYFDVLALRLLAATDPRLRNTANQRFSSGLDEYVRLYEAMLRLSGRRVTPPLDVHDAALIFAALGEGFAMQSALGIDQPWRPRDGAATSEPPWPLLAIAVRCLVDALTEPV